jgi:ribosomal protein L37AE/L43A
MKSDEEINDLIKEVLWLIAERERLLKIPPTCERCKTNEMWLISTCQQVWKCKQCQNEIMTMV